MTSTDQFSEATQAWFAGAFAAPTPAQEGAWEAISEGRHALVVAPTGSGKTLLGVPLVDRPAGHRAACRRPKRRCRVLYVSPLKALGVDVERNLRAPLVGHPPDRDAARACRSRRSRVGVRSGDTPADRAPLLLARTRPTS